jgi:hypothetical protein
LDSGRFGESIIIAPLEHRVSHVGKRFLGGGS